MTLTYSVSSLAMSGSSYFVMPDSIRVPSRIRGAAKSSSAGFQGSSDALIVTHRGNGFSRRRPDVELCCTLSGELPTYPEPCILHANVNDRGEEERHDLREEKPTNYGNAEGSSGFRPCAESERDRQCTHQCGHGGHHDRPESHQASLIDGLCRRFVFASLCLECKVDHHDGVLFDDTDEHDDANESVNVQIHIQQRRNPPLHCRRMKEIERQKSAEACGRQA